MQLRLVLDVLLIMVLLVLDALPISNVLQLEALSMLIEGVMVVTLGVLLVVIPLLEVVVVEELQLMLYIGVPESELHDSEIPEVWEAVDIDDEVEVESLVGGRILLRVVPESEVMVVYIVGLELLNITDEVEVEVLTVTMFLLE